MTSIWSLGTCTKLDIATAGADTIAATGYSYTAMLCADQAFSLKVGPSATATTSDAWVPANTIICVSVGAGDALSVLGKGTGTCTVTEVKCV